MLQYWAVACLALVACATTHAQTPLPIEGWPAGIAPRLELPTARSVDYDFSNVDVTRIESWLSWFGIELPVSASGKLSGWLWAQRGTSGWFTFKDYRVEGYVSSPRLQLEQYSVEAAELRFGYAGGDWYIGRLNGIVKPKDEGAVIGEASLQAKIPTSAAQLLETSGTIQSVDIGPLLRSLGVDLELKNDAGGALKYSGRVPLAQASDLRAWTANAALRLDSLQLPDLPPASLIATAELARGAWSVVDGTVIWLDQPIRVIGGGQLSGDYPYDFSLQGKELSLSQALQTFGLLDLASQLSGSLNLDAKLSGDAVQGVAKADIIAQAPLVEYQSLQFAQIDLRGAYHPQSITLELLRADYAGGLLDATSSWRSLEQLAQGYPDSLQLTLQGLQLNQLPADWLPLDLEGIATGKVLLQTQNQNNQSVWASTGNLSVRGLAADTTAIGDAQLNWSKELVADTLQLDLVAADESLTSDLTIDLEDVDRDLKQVRITGYRAAGRVQQFETVVRLPDLPGDPMPLQLTGTYTLQGTPANWLERGRAELALLRIVLSGETWELQSATAVLNPESLGLEQFRILDPRGAELSGSSRWSSWQQVAQRLPDAASLKLKGLQLDALPEQLPDALRQLALAGLASGELSLQSQWLDDRLEWAAQGTLNINQFAAAQTSVGDLRVTWRKELAESVARLDLNTADGAIAADLAVTLDTTAADLQQTQWTEFRGTARVKEFETLLPVATTGRSNLPVQVTGTLELQGTPDNWLQRGTATLEEVVTIIGDQPIALQQAVVHVSPEEFRLERFHLFDPRGRVAGAAIVRRDGSERHYLNLRIVDVSLTQYSPLLDDSPLSAVDGIAALEVRLNKAADIVDWQQGWQGSLKATLKDLAYREVPVGSLSVTGVIEGDAIDARLEGEILKGQALVTARFPTTALTVGYANPQARGDQQPFSFDASLIGVDISRLLGLITDPRQAALVAGVATLETSGSWTQEDRLRWDAQLQIPLMLHRSKPLARDFRLTTNYAAGLLQVRELSGGIAGGRLDARGTFPLDLLDSLDEETVSNSNGELRFDAQRVQLNWLVNFLFPGYADQFSGIVSYRGAARYDRQIYLRGDAHATDALAFGLPIQSGHGNLAINLNLDGSLDRLSTHNLTGTAMGGKFVGEIDLRGGSRYELAAGGRITAGKLDQLSRALGFDHILGTGRFDGRVQLGSSDASSLAALSGLLQIDFDRGDAQSVPLLPDLARYVPVLQLASTDITDGRLRARIGQGVLRIQDLFLNGDAFWLVGQGYASLIGGQLDIEAVLQTGGGIEQQAKQQVVQRLALGLLPQAALLIEINDLLRNRSLYFHIGGTTSQPVIQARLVQTLGKALLQNVGRSLLGAPAAFQTEMN